MSAKNSELAERIVQTRTAWLESHGVPVSHEFADFLEAIGEGVDALRSSTVSDPHVEVILTDLRDVHCFKLVFHVAPQSGEERLPVEIHMHTTQAIDLLHKLGMGISEYFQKASAELLEIKTRSLR